MPRCKGSRPWSSAAPTSWANRWRSCCWRRTRPSPSPIRARAICPRCAAARAVEADRRLVVGQRPDHQAVQSALHEVATRGGEQLAAEAETLEFRPQIKLVDLAVVVQAARAVAAVVGVARDAIAESQHR